MLPRSCRSDCLFVLLHIFCISYYHCNIYVCFLLFILKNLNIWKRFLVFQSWSFSVCIMIKRTKDRSDKLVHQWNIITPKYQFIQVLWLLTFYLSCLIDMYFHNCKIILTNTEWSPHFLIWLFSICSTFMKQLPCLTAFWAFLWWSLKNLNS